MTYMLHILLRLAACSKVKIDINALSVNNLQKCNIIFCYAVASNINTSINEETPMDVPIKTNLQVSKAVSCSS